TMSSSLSSHRHLHSFPTRRSSDLQQVAGGAAEVSSGVAQVADGVAPLEAGAQDLAAGAEQLKTGSATLQAGIVRLAPGIQQYVRSEEHTSELQSRENLVCRLLLEK